MRQNSNEFRKSKRIKLQQNIKSMFLRSGPKFTEAVGLQRVCRYCSRKFEAPQGLAVHLHMHERAGDLPIMDKKEKHASIGEVRRSNALLQPRNPNQNLASRPSSVPQSNKANQAVSKVLPKDLPLSSLKSSMTRRFTIAEKLIIINKFKESKNVSQTCR